MPKKPDEVVYIYEPREGLHVVGLPQRDLKQADVDRAGPGPLRDALASGLYRKATKTESEKKRRKPRLRLRPQRITSDDDDLECAA
jgi:hypothetical protein